MRSFQRECLIAVIPVLFLTVLAGCRAASGSALNDAQEQVQAMDQPEAGHPAPAAVTTKHDHVARTGVNAQESQLTPESVASGKFHKLFSLPVRRPGRDLPARSGGRRHGWRRQQEPCLHRHHEQLGLRLRRRHRRASVDADAWHARQRRSLRARQAGDRQQALRRRGDAGPRSRDRHALRRALGLRGRRQAGLPPLCPRRERLAPSRPTSSSTASRRTRASITRARSFAPPCCCSTFRAATVPPHKILIIAAAGGEGKHDAHGWVLAYDTKALAAGGEQPPAAAFCTTPHSGAGGVWMAAQGPAAAADGTFFVITGNGPYDGVNDFGESFLKLLLPTPVRQRARVAHPRRLVHAVPGCRARQQASGSGPRLGLADGDPRDQLGDRRRQGRHPLRHEPGGHGRARLREAGAAAVHRDCTSRSPASTRCTSSIKPPPTTRRRHPRLTTARYTISTRRQCFGRARTLAPCSTSGARTLACAFSRSTATSLGPKPLPSAKPCPPRRRRASAVCRAAC